MNKIISLVLIFILGLVFVACVSGAPRVGERAPDFRLPDLNGQQVSLSSQRGAPVIINFWASWCGPCWAEMPLIQGVFEEWSAKGVVVLTVNLGERRSVVARYMQDNHLSFPVLLDAGGEVAERYNVVGVPTTFFIGRDGIIQEIVPGAFPSKAALETVLREIVQ
jgi:peroxiredoxin